MKLFDSMLPGFRRNKDFSSEEKLKALFLIAEGNRKIPKFATDRSNYYRYENFRRQTSTILSSSGADQSRLLLKFSVKNKELLFLPDFKKDLYFNKK